MDSLPEAVAEKLVYPVFSPVRSSALGDQSTPAVVQLQNGHAGAYESRYRNVDVISMIENMQNQLTEQNNRITAQNDRITVLEKTVGHLARHSHCVQLDLTECPICQTRTRLKLLFCGHTMCETCMSNVSSNQCPFCRDGHPCGFVRNPETLSPPKNLDDFLRSTMSNR